MLSLQNLFVDLLVELLKSKIDHKSVRHTVFIYVHGMFKNSDREAEEVSRINFEPRKPRKNAIEDYKK